ncbi:MAG: glycosyl transferase family 2, partial [Chloroflexi bacterium]|nr:glycosyl transferase family 2 [Chloroflexota bacterium]
PWPPPGEGVVTPAPRLSIVIPNYDGEEHLTACLEALAELDYPADRREVIVVDNGSKDGSVQLIRRDFPSVRVVQSGSNLGLAAACNRGAHEATGSVVAFLNNDMRVQPGWARELVQPLIEQSDVAATGGRILSWTGKAIDFVGGTVNFYGHGFQPLHGRPAEESELAGPKPLLFACGGSMAVRRDVFLACGGFDEDFFAFFEDIDLGWRLWVLGYRVLYVPSAVAYHKGHATGSRMPAHQLRLLYERNAMATIIKNYDDANLARVLPAALFLAAKRALVYGHVDTSPYEPWADASEEVEQIRRVGTAHMVALAQLSDQADHLWAKRAAVQNARRRGDRDVLALLEEPFQTNCLDEDYMEVQRGVQRVFGIDRLFEAARVAPRVLIISNDTVNARMAGPGIRCWEMAKVLARSQTVTLAVPNEDPPCVDGFQIATYASKTGRELRELAAAHDVLVVQGFVLHLFPYLAQLGKVLVVDLYDPFTLENLHVFSHDPMEERTTVHESHLGVLNAQIRAGDFFLCASEKQRDYWIGMLAANNRINPHQYDADPSVRNLIDVVPFGVQSEPPRRTAPALKGAYPGIGVDDRVILWGGGIWEWFDPLTLIRAVGRINETRPEVKLFFMGIKHPNPLVPDMAMTARAMDLARELNLEGKSVFFNEWVPYDERQNYLLEADVGTSLHFEHLETRYSFRTRVLDYIWAGLPVVCTGGDAVGDLVEKHDLGHVVPVADVDAVVDALCAVLDAPGGRTAYAERFSELARDLTWENAIEPLARFCADPHMAPDRVAAVARVEKVEAGGDGRGARGRSVSLLAAPPLPTPIWRLPKRAITYIQMGGLPRLLSEIRSYIRWLGLRAHQ